MPLWPSWRSSRDGKARSRCKTFQWKERMEWHLNQYRSFFGKHYRTVNVDIPLTNLSKFHPVANLSLSGKKSTSSQESEKWSSRIDWNCYRESDDCSDESLKAMWLLSMQPMKTHWRSSDSSLSSSTQIRANPSQDGMSDLERSNHVIPENIRKWKMKQDQYETDSSKGKLLHLPKQNSLGQVFLISPSFSSSPKATATDSPESASMFFPGLSGSGACFQPPKPASRSFANLAALFMTPSKLGVSISISARFLREYFGFSIDSSEVVFEVNGGRYLEDRAFKNEVPKASFGLKRMKEAGLPACLRRVRNGE